VANIIKKVEFGSISRISKGALYNDKQHTTYNSTNRKQLIQ